MLAALSTKPSKLPVDPGRILRHELKVTERPPLSLENVAGRKTDAAIVRTCGWTVRGKPRRRARTKPDRVRVKWARRSDA